MVSFRSAGAMEEPTAPPVDLACRDEGDGPTIVLLHGIGGNRTVWNSVLPGLAREHRVLALDLRGHGKSPSPPDSRYTFLELEQDIARSLDQKGVSSAHMVGFSGGALLALRWALDRPGRTRSLVMVSGAAYIDAHTRSIAERWTETYTQEGPDRFALRMLKDLYYPDWIEAHLEVADVLRAEVRHQDFTPAARWARSMMSFDERGRVGSLRIPTLIVQAMDDAVVDASHGRILRQSIAGSQIRILAATGHIIPIERPEETVETVSDFLRKVEEGGPSGTRST